MMKLMLFFSPLLLLASVPKDSVSTNDLKREAFKALEYYNDTITDKTEFTVTTIIAIIGVLVAVLGMLPISKGNKETYIQKVLGKINTQTLKPFLGIVFAIILGFLLFSKAITLIYLICAVVSTSALVLFVSMYYLQNVERKNEYIEKKNEPKRIIVEGIYYPSINEGYLEEYQHNLLKLKSYFENQYVTSSTKIIYCFTKDNSELKNIFYVSVENDEIYNKIKLIIENSFNSKGKNEVVLGLPYL